VRQQRSQRRGHGQQALMGERDRTEMRDAHPWRVANVCSPYKGR
jgi:hypothetical protein